MHEFLWLFYDLFWFLAFLIVRTTAIINEIPGLKSQFTVIQFQFFFCLRNELK